MNTPTETKPRFRAQARDQRLGPKQWWRELPPGELTRMRGGDIVCGDAHACLSAIADEVADIVFLDPPFNLGKSYGPIGADADRIAPEDYENYIRRAIEEAIRVLKPGGALYLYHIPRWAISLAQHLERLLSFKHWIAVSMKNGFVRGSGLYPAHYALLHYTKGVPNVEKRPKIQPLTCPHCDEFIRDYGGYRGHVEHGINLSDVWDDLSPVRHRKYKHRTANELPLAIPRRVVGISGVRGGLLVDPFAGTGTSVVAARLGRMRYIAVDREPENCSIIAERIRATTNRYRKIKGERDD